MMGGILPWEWPKNDAEERACLEEQAAERPHGNPLGFAGFRESHRCAMLHCGRAAWECVLRGEMERRERMGLPGIRRVLMPRFTCSTVWEPLRRLGLRGETYGISRSLEPVLPADAGEEEVLLLTDYFGVSADTVRRAGMGFPGLVVVDATMAFFARYDGLWPEARPWAAYYSVRKFAGVPDGGVAVASFDLPLPVEFSRSGERVRPLLLRRDHGAVAAAKASEAAEAGLSGPALRMSGLTRLLVQRVDWERVNRRRCENYARLHEALGRINRLSLPARVQHGPFCYPLLSGIPGLRDELVDAGVALPLLWPEVIEACPPESAENEVARSLLPLPLDHRYGPHEMDWLIRLILG